MRTSKVWASLPVFSNLSQNSTKSNTTHPFLSESCMKNISPHLGWYYLTLSRHHKWRYQHIKKMHSHRSFLISHLIFAWLLSALAEHLWRPLESSQRHLRWCNGVLGELITLFRTTSVRETGIKSAFSCKEIKTLSLQYVEIFTRHHCRSSQYLLGTSLDLFSHCLQWSFEKIPFQKKLWPHWSNPLFLTSLCRLISSNFSWFLEQSRLSRRLPKLPWGIQRCQRKKGKGMLTWKQP